MAKSIELKSIEFYVIFFLQLYGFLAWRTTRYMESKPPVYRSMFPDNRNFCSRLSFLFKSNKIVSNGL